MEDIKVGKLRRELKNSGYKNCFQEISIQQQGIMRGDKMVIPKTLIVDVLHAAHLGHPGRGKMTRQVRLSWWWPK